MSMPKCLVFQDLEGLTKVFRRMSAGMSGQKLPLWADFSFLSFVHSHIHLVITGECFTPSLHSREYINIQSREWWPLRYGSVKECNVLWRDLHGQVLGATGGLWGAEGSNLFKCGLSKPGVSQSPVILWDPLRHLKEQTLTSQSNLGDNEKIKGSFCIFWGYFEPFMFNKAWRIWTSEYIKKNTMGNKSVSELKAQFCNCNG